VALLDQPVRDFLDEIAAAGTTPAGGSVAALVAACAAALLAKIARASSGWSESTGVAAQADSLRERATALVQEVAEEYEAALRARADESEAAGPRRDFALGRAYARAAEPPLQLARLAADVAQLAVVVAQNSDPALRADAVTAASLAAGAAGAAAELVAVNLTASATDPRVKEARQLEEDAARAAAEARAARE
jgi:formiminotetrahydrofolate cyclodeaminase